MTARPRSSITRLDVIHFRFPVVSNNDGQGYPGDAKVTLTLADGCQLSLSAEGRQARPTGPELFAFLPKLLAGR
ncbi:hypothetical protein C5C03_00310 [Clavibacter michiganensis]|nr:hypothetical protein C5C03_00310 [Clavibacter michiganensis]PPF99345.1 hypothetical protein C5C05_02115 [Clavibacter michiganensis]